MKNLSIMLKPASSMCDMRCGYCFYTDVASKRKVPFAGLMSKETAKAIIGNVCKSLSAGDKIAFCFQGGEPGLMGLDFFEFFKNEAKAALPPGVQVSFAMQTNGLMVDENWCEFFKANEFLVGLSLDGCAALHNENRKDAKGQGTFSRVMRAKRLLDKHGVQYNVLSVLTAKSARMAKKTWDFILKENIRYIQFIPCLQPLGAPPGNAHLSPGRFHRFYSDLFPLWENEAKQGNVVRLRLFEDLLGIAQRGRSFTCGMEGKCAPQFVVEADGSVYPCDFYVLDEYKACNLAEVTPKDAFDVLLAGGFFEKAPLPKWCEECPHKAWCNGGCKRMAETVYGPGCGMRRFLDEWGWFFGV